MQKAIDWQTLASRIEKGNCTPFVGAGTARYYIPDAKNLTKTWRKEFGLPIKTNADLTDAAQFLALETDSMRPKEILADMIDKKHTGKPFQSDDPYMILARLPVKIYMTTNYDSLLERAISQANRQPKTKICGWHIGIRDQDAEDEIPTVANPWVYHLHGHYKLPESMVLTEDDYTHFLVNFGEALSFLDSRIHEAITRKTLLFLGYSLKDSTFRVLFRALFTRFEYPVHRRNITVQLPREGKYQADQRAHELWAEYFRSFSADVYWGSIEKFLNELTPHVPGLESTA